MAGSATREFQNQLTDLLPKMRIWALAITRSRSAADDLVQEVAMRALTASDSFILGTNFAAWVHRIMINQFITTIRKRREHTELDQVPETAIPAAQHDLSELRELNLAFRRLPQDQQDALRWIALDERTYEEVSDATGCAIGTLKSRVHRARVNLRSEISGEIREAA
jgi:RNA polymerase sigma-70 factor, ECF subfamily